MAIQVRPDYVNPLTSMASREGRRKSGPSPAAADKKPDTVTKLRTEQQKLQSQMLLLKATGTDSAGATAKSQELLEEKLKDLTQELRAAKTKESRLSGQEKDADSTEKVSVSRRPSWDWYEKGR